MGVLLKLKRLQEILKRNGRMKIVYEELLKNQVPSSDSTSESQMSNQELENALISAKEAVIKSVLGGTSLPKKQEENAPWWNPESNLIVDANGDNIRIGSGSFFKSMVMQFLRQFLFAFVLFGIMVLGMYITDSLPAANKPDEGTPRPAYVTKDRDIHTRISEGRYPSEL